MNLKEKVMELCEERGISVRELERKAGLKDRVIQHWDKSDPSGPKLYAVANALDVPIEELLSVYDPDYERVAYIETLRRKLDQKEELESKYLIREELRDNPAFRILYDATDGATNADLLEAASIIARRKEERENR